jgi:hypothetical protein
MTTHPANETLPNGSGAGAVLAAGIGCFVLGLLSFAGDKSPAIKSALVFYKPTGALSGVTAVAIVVWLLSWALLEWRWRRLDVKLSSVCLWAFSLLALSFLLTFPPFVDLL